jgi:hypothetical protein
MRIGPGVCGKPVAAYEAVEIRGIDRVTHDAGIFPVLFDKYEDVSDPTGGTDGGTEEEQSYNGKSHGDPISPVWMIISIG